MGALNFWNKWVPIIWCRRAKSLLDFFPLIFLGKIGDFPLFFLNSRHIETNHVGKRQDKSYFFDGEACDRQIKRTLHNPCSAYHRDDGRSWYFSKDMYNPSGMCKLGKRFYLVYMTAVLITTSPVAGYLVTAFPVSQETDATQYDNIIGKKTFIDTPPCII